MSYRTMTLGQVAPATTAEADLPDDDDQVWLLNLDQVEPHTGRLLSKQIVDFDQAGGSTNWFDESNVLYSKLRPYLNKVYLPDGKGLCTTELVPLKPNPDLITREYLAHYLRSEKFLRWVNEQIDGAKMPRVSMKIFWNHEINLPPLEEQKRIAAILDKADTLRRKRAQAIALANDFLRATFLDLFGDPVTNPKGWPMQSLKELGKVKTGGTPPSSKEGMFDGAVPFITPGDLENAKESKRSLTEAGALESVTVRAGSTLVCCIGATIGKMGKASSFCAFNQQINAVEWHQKIADDYGFYALKFFKEVIAKNGASTTLPILKKSLFEKIEIPVPPHDLQDKFVRLVQGVESARKINLEHEDALMAINRALAASAF